MKIGIRALGIDDGPLTQKTLIVGVIMRRDRVEGVLSTRVKRDGNEATKKIIGMIEKSRFSSQIHVIFLNGVAVAGFNLVDYVKLSEKFKVPVIVVTPNQPHPRDLEKAVEKWEEKKKIWERIKKPAYLLETKLGQIWFQYSGTTKREAEKLIKHFLIHSKVPEPLRIAHLIAAGIELGESRGL